MIKGTRGLRWWVVSLVAIATIINYIDRQSLGVLWPEIANDLYPDKTDDQRKEIYGLIKPLLNLRLVPIMLRLILKLILIIF